MTETIVKLYKPHAKQRELHFNDTRFKVLNWGRRTGKSTFAVNETFKQAINKVGRYWIIAPSYKQAKNIYWRDLIKHIPDVAIAKKNESELILHIKNGSTIELKGGDNPDSLRGAGINGVVLDEYAFMRPFVYDEIIGPMIRQTKGWAIFISTPDGFNHFFALAEQARNDTTGEWLYSHATAYDNPYFENEELDKERLKLVENAGDDGEIRFRQEYLAEFKKKTGLVYKTFDREVHLVDPIAMPREYTVHALTVDFGWENPTAALLVGIDYDNNWWIRDELYRSHLQTEQLATILKQKMGTTQYTYKIGDSAASQEIANLEAQGISLTPVIKSSGSSRESSITAGIRLIQDKLKVQGNGKPKLFISRSCSNLIWEMETYSYPEGRENQNASEEPIKENDHALDALRYLALTVNSAQAPDDEPYHAPAISTLIY